MDAAANHDVVAIATRLMFIAALFQVFDGSQTVAAGGLRGYKDTAIPTVIAGIGYWGIGFVGGWLLAFPLGYGCDRIVVGPRARPGGCRILLGMRLFHIGRSAARSILPPER